MTEQDAVGPAREAPDAHKLSEGREGREMREAPEVSEIIAMVSADGRAGELLRAARRRADLSQRELAEVCGVSRRVVETAEADRPGRLTVASLAGLLSTLGLRLIAVDTLSRPLLRGSADQVFDRAGRHYPAHLEVRTTGRWGDWWGDHAYASFSPVIMPRERPVRTFDRARMPLEWRQAHPSAEPPTSTMEA